MPSGSRNVLGRPLIAASAAPRTQRSALVVVLGAIVRLLGGLRRLRRLRRLRLLPSAQKRSNRGIVLRGIVRCHDMLWLLLRPRLRLLLWLRPRLWPRRRRLRLLLLGSGLARQCKGPDSGGRRRLNCSLVSWRILRRLWSQSLCDLRQLRSDTAWRDSRAVRPNVVMAVLLRARRPRRLWRSCRQ